MGNPLWDFLTMKALKPSVPLPDPPETKLYAIDDWRAALTSRMLVHGPGATELLDAAGRGAEFNSAVYSCLMALSMAFFEPPLRVFRGQEHGDHEMVLDSPIQSLLDTPNPAMSGKELQFWLAWAQHCDGNAYLQKLRSGNPTTGNVVELWPVSPHVIRPVTVRKTDFISFYRRDLGSGKYEDIPTENVVHLKLGMDDRDHRLGIAPIKRLVRQIASDDEATRFAAALLANYGIPGLVVTLDAAATLSREQAEDVKARVEGAYGGDNRGNVAVLSPGAKMEQIGFSPEALNLKALHQIPETRICSVMRVPPAVAGLSVGLEQTSNYASFREVREMFTEGTLLPLWALNAEKFTQALRPDFTPDRQVFLAYDTSEVRALQEDVTARYTRLNVAVQGGWVKPNEARAEVGFPPLPELDAPAEPAQPPALRVVKELKAARQGDLTGLGDVLQALVALAEPDMEREVAEYLAEQKRRLQRRLVSG